MRERKDKNTGKPRGGKPPGKGSKPFAKKSRFEDSNRSDTPRPRNSKPADSRPQAARPQSPSPDDARPQGSRPTFVRPGKRAFRPADDEQPDTPRRSGGKPQRPTGSKPPRPTGAKPQRAAGSAPPRPAGPKRPFGPQRPRPTDPFGNALPRPSSPIRRRKPRRRPDREHGDEPSIDGAPTPGGERLHKYLARSGFGGRLKCEELILQGLVSVNGKTVRELGFKIDVSADDVEVAGETVVPPEPVYVVLNKPAGVVSGDFDPGQGRRRAVDMVGELGVRLQPVGRLDTDSAGLLLLTNDGELSNRLTHPRFGVTKTYLVEVAGEVAPAVLTGLVEGVWLSEGRAKVERARVIHNSRVRSTMEIVLREGRNRQIRRMLAKLGKAVKRLQRVKMGPLTLGRLKPGEFRECSAAEVEAIRRVSAAPQPAAEKDE